MDILDDMGCELTYSNVAVEPQFKRSGEPIFTDTSILIVGVQHKHELTSECMKEPVQLTEMFSRSISV